MFGTLSVSLKQTTQVVVTGAFLLNFFLTAALSQLWALINTQQIIVMMPLFNVNLPANAAECFGFIMTLASFNLLPMNIFYNAYLGIA
jgi:hypothetical protein